MVCNCHAATWEAKFRKGVESISVGGNSIVIGDPLQQTDNPVEPELPD